MGYYTGSANHSLTFFGVFNLLRGKPRKLKGKASQIGIYMDEENLEWLQDNVRDENFDSVSAGVRECVTFVRNYIEANPDALKKLKQLYKRHGIEK